MSEPNLPLTEQLPQPSPPSQVVPEGLASAGSSAGEINYPQLVRFLVCPFLDSPELLKVDCETSPRTMRVLVRVAFGGNDQGRVFGRGGRNLQAVRTVIQAVAQAAGHSAHLEVFGNQTSGSSGSPSGQPSGETADPAAHRSPPPAPRRLPQPRLNK